VADPLKVFFHSDTSKDGTPAVDIDSDDPDRIAAMHQQERVMAWQVFVWMVFIVHTIQATPFPEDATADGVIVIPLFLRLGSSQIVFAGFHCSLIVLSFGRSFKVEGLWYGYAEI
jgi:hypothetical protein